MNELMYFFALTAAVFFIALFFPVKKKHNYLIVEYHDFDDMKKSVYERMRDGYKIHAMTHIPTMDGKSLYTVVFLMPI